MIGSAEIMGKFSKEITAHSTCENDAQEARMIAEAYCGTYYDVPVVLLLVVVDYPAGTWYVVPGTTTTFM